MATRSLGTLTLDLIAKIAGFTGPLSKAEREAQKKTQGISKAVNAMKATFVAAGVAAIGATAALVKQSINMADEAQKNAQAIGLNAEKMQELVHAMKLSGVEQSEFLTGMRQFGRSVSEASKDVAKYAEAYDSIGVKTKGADGKLRDTHDLLLEVADRFAGMKDGAAKTALAMDIFGKAGARIIPFLNNGSAGIEVMTKQARDLGLVMDEDTRKAAERFNDSLTIMQDAMRGVVNRLTTALMPSLDTLATKMVEVAKSLDLDAISRMIDRVISGFETFAVVVGTRVVLAVGMAAVKMGVLFTQTLAATGALTAMRTVLLTLAGPAGWIALAAGGAYALSQAFDDSEEKARQMAKAVKGLTGELVGLSKTQLELKKINLSEQLAKQAVEIQGIGEKVAAARNKLRESMPMSGEGLIPDVGNIKINIDATVETQNLKQQFGEATTAITATGKAIQEVDAALGRVNKLSAAGGGDELNELVATTKNATDAIAETIKELEFQVATLGMSEEATARYKLALAGATDTQLAYVETLQGRLRSDKELQDSIQREIDSETELQSLYDQHIGIITGVDSSVLQYIDTLGELKQLLDAGKISWDEYTAAINRAKPAYDDAGTGADSFSELALEAAKRSQGAFADFLYDPFAEGLDGMFSGFTNTLRRMIAEAAAAEIFESLTKDAKNFSDVFANIFGGSGGGDSGGSWLQSAGNLVSGIFGGGRASGGPVMAGSFYEVGEFNRPELLRVNNKQYLIPGNDGAVEPMRGGGRRGGGNTYQTWNITTPNPDGFRATERQQRRQARRFVS